MFVLILSVSPVFGMSLEVIVIWPNERLVTQIKPKITSIHLPAKVVLMKVFMVINFNVDYDLIFRLRIYQKHIITLRFHSFNNIFPKIFITETFRS